MLAMRARLADRYLATIEIVTREPNFVDLGAGTSRSRIEHRLRSPRLKVGDFIGRDRALAQSAARAIFDDRHGGLIAPSAEHPHAQTVAIFETARESNELRAAMAVLSVRPASADTGAVAAALGMLLRTEGFSPFIHPEVNLCETMDRFPSPAAQLRTA
jgi:hypothetical protein